LSVSPTKPVASSSTIDEKTVAFLRRTFREHYFKHHDAVEIPAMIESREFGYTPFGKGMVRHLSYRSPGELAADLVKQVYRGQIDQGMVAVQQAMLAMWQQSSVSTNGSLISTNGHSSATNGTLHRLGGDTAEQDGSPSAAEMLYALQRFEQAIQQGGHLSHLTALTKAFISELQQVLRTEAFELAESTTQQEVVYR
jgi:hypothetical protein